MMIKFGRFSHTNRHLTEKRRQRKKKQDLFVCFSLHFCSFLATTVPFFLQSSWKKKTRKYKFWLWLVVKYSNKMKKKHFSHHHHGFNLHAMPLCHVQWKAVRGFNLFVTKIAVIYRASPLKQTQVETQDKIYSRVFWDFYSDFFFDV